jgi:23S rRNA (cytidine1920-2'-O)/16S rRNA (cytidine1409-2'-O)-methyltransferase
MRLDVYLTDKGLVDSRTDAKNFILAGAVSVNGKAVKKPAHEVDGSESISVDKSSKKYVSRGGLKLEGALDAFNIDPSGVLAIDIGASSGGFTDCLLKRGARQVIAVDSGYGQLVDSIRNDERVSVYENFNARYMSAEDFEFTPSLAVMDVSFISAKLILPAVGAVISDGGDFVCLIKPQFEVGRSGLNKKGIVKNDTLRKNAVDEVIDFASACGFGLCGLIESPIVGGDGNVEYLAHFKKMGLK